MTSTPAPHERLDPLVGPRSGADGSPDPELFVTVLAGVGVLTRLLDVLHGDQPAQLEIPIHHQHLLDSVLVQKRADLALGGALAYRDEPILRCHRCRDRVVEMGLEAQVAVGHDAHELRAVDNRHPRDVMLPGQLDHVADARPRGYGDGIRDDATLVLLDNPHLSRLLAGGHVLVDDADTARLRDADCQPSLGHGIHGRGHERNVQPDLAGETRTDFGVAGKNLGVAGNQEYVVERERLRHLEHRAKLQGLRGSRIV